MLSVRDLVRQIPAEWQENVKHRSGMSYARFLARITDPARNSRIASWFWSVQEVPDILDRWGADLPPERIHLVTVPSPGGAPDLLWKRFSQAFGLEGIDLDLEAERVNPSLGVPETALIRRINRAANRSLEPGDYRPLVRELLAHQTLSRRVASPRLALPPAHRAVGAGASRRRGSPRSSARGYDVVGDLHDLRGNADAAPVRRPRPPARARRRRRRRRRHQGAAARERADARGGGPAAGASSAETRAALDRSYLRRQLPAPREGRAGGLTRQRAWAGVCSAIYRFARGRSSRSA